jgi:hypothetical protein
MSSTYSALKIELIGTGEQSGTWGATTNVNLGDNALGEAITGSATVDFASAADVTISLIDTNTTQVARNLRLNITESGAGIGYTGNLILGSNCQIEKLYLVNNNTTATKTIKNTTGTGIAIPAGKSMFVFNNAVNVVEAVNSAISMAVTGAVSGSQITSTVATGTAPLVVASTTPVANLSILGNATNITGTLAVAQGGTGAIATTGSGFNVLGTSPTLITPILGTPTSGNLANCTGYPAGSITGTVNLATQVTGTLAVTNGGTGVTTSTGSGNVVLSTSPTLVTPILGIPQSGTLTNATGLPLTTGVIGTLAVTNGGTGVTTSTGSGSVVLSTSPTLVTPLLGTPTSGNLANCTFPTLNQNTTGNAATATNPASGGTFITSSNIASQSVSFATTASSATNATNATNATTAATVSTTIASGATGTTQSAGTNNTTIATTAFVQAAITGTGYGTMASQNANSVAITGGTINGVSGTNASMTVGNATNATTATNLSGGTVSATTIGGTTITASTQFSGPGTGLTGTASSLTAGAANSVAYSNVSGKPDTGLYLVWSGVVSGGGGNGGTYNHYWTILYSGSPAREMPSPDSFMVVTALNDYYTTNYAGGYATYTISKAVYVANPTLSGNSQFGVTINFSGYPTPNQINMSIYVQSATAVTSLTFIS